MSGSISSTPEATDSSAQRHAEILEQALNIMRTRNDKRGDAWREAGWKGNLVEMRKKLDRLWALWKYDMEPDPKDVDEALDLINAAVFWIRCVEESNEDGSWPWP